MKEAVEAIFDQMKEVEASLGRPPLIHLQDRLNRFLPISLNIPDEVLQIELAGRRCILLQDMMSDKSDGRHGSPIIIPDNARNPLGAGWVVNIGHLWGLPGQPDDRGTFFGMFRNRWEIVGHKVLFGDWVGQDLFLELTDRRFQAKFKVLAEHEVWGLDGRKADSSPSEA